MPAGGPAVDLLAGATLLVLQLCPPLRSAWRWTDALGLLWHSQPRVRWCAARATALVLGLSDHAAAALECRVLSPDEAVACAVAWHNQRAAAAAERATMFLGGGGPGAEAGGRKRKYEEVAPPRVAVASGHVDVCGIELPERRGQAAAQAAPCGRLVRTPTVERNLEAVVLGAPAVWAGRSRVAPAAHSAGAARLPTRAAPLPVCAAGLCVGRAVLLEGPPGSGKSALVEHLAAVTGNADDMVRIHLDDQVDSKSLMGAYVCTSRPGEFVWQPGPLTQVSELPGCAVRQVLAGGEAWAGVDCPPSIGARRRAWEPGCRRASPAGSLLRLTRPRDACSAGRGPGAVGCYRGYRPGSRRGAGSPGPAARAPRAACRGARRERAGGRGLPGLCDRDLLGSW